LPRFFLDNHFLALAETDSGKPFAADTKRGDFLAVGRNGADG
jgi:hypothetical protein